MFQARGVGRFLVIADGTSQSFIEDGRSRMLKIQIGNTFFKSLKNSEVANTVLNNNNINKKLHQLTEICMKDA